MAVNNINKQIRSDINQQVLIGKDSLSPESPWILMNAQYTITAYGLTPGLEIHFEVAVIKGGAPGELCGCMTTPPTMSQIVGTYPLLCPECSAEDKVYVRLTHNNSYAVLDDPQGSAIRAVLVNAYTNEPIQDEGIIQDIQVLAAVNTNSALTAPEFRGCPPDCAVDGKYIPTFRFPCEGMGFAPTDIPRDPTATTELTDCDGNPIVYIYPKPKPKATTPIKDCAGNVLGYALDSINSGCGDDGGCGGSNKEANSFVIDTVERNGKQYLVWSDGRTTPLIIKR